MSVLTLPLAEVSVAPALKKKSRAEASGGSLFAAIRPKAASQPTVPIYQSTMYGVSDGFGWSCDYEENRRTKQCQKNEPRRRQRGSLRLSGSAVKQRAR